MAIDRKGTIARNAERQEHWRSRTALWNQVEEERVRSSRRCLPHRVKSQGLITCHGGTFESWCSLLCTVTAQWAWHNVPSTVIDSSNRVGEALSEFLAHVMPDDGFVSSRTVESALRHSLIEGGDEIYDLSSWLGRENLLTAMFGYVDGVGANRVDDDIADYDSLLRDIALAVAEDGGRCDLTAVVAALLYLVDPANDGALDRVQVQALDRMRPRYEHSPHRNRLLSRLEMVVGMVSTSDGSGRCDPSEASVIDVLTTTPAGGANSRTIQQRLTAELAIGMLQSLPTDHNVALVFSDFDDHATAFLDRLSEAAGRRRGTTLVFFPRFNGNIGEWVTRSHQRGPLIQVLQDADDAERAARYFGQQHRFMVTQRSFERGQNSSDTWSHDTSVSFGRVFSVTGGLSRSFTDGSSSTSSRSQSSAHTIGTSVSESEVTSRVLEFDVNPVEIQRMGATSGIIRQIDDRRPVGVDCFPALWLVAQQDRERELMFEARWGISPADFAKLPATYASVEPLVAREVANR
ncbi:hypothetical protein [Candidatus Microthrix parvicella]|uniref:hypothetical protein n=1 Tax=Candidatus Neomicrothrix parvicella TaxID=41950 RepID=UPI001F18422F|nr:hypothetical protein [Candidatus Microthrix parvicella]